MSGPRSARRAGLVYTTDAGPGISRKRSGRGFAYRDARGRRVQDRRKLERIRSLAIPPAWTDVWICPDERGHLQATGRDARGRKQYKYHPRWREVRDETKFDRMAEFARALPVIRKRVRADLRREGLPREKVLASIVRLLDEGCFRIGNDAYARENGSFGLTTLRARHVTVRGAKVRFKFKGKSGQEHEVDLEDRRVAAVLRTCLDLPGQTLFRYADDDGQVRAIDAGDVNEYLRETTGEDFTTKDFRTWVGTVRAFEALKGQEKPETKKALTRITVEAVEHVARALGNTPAVARSAYIHPTVLESFADGSLASARAATVRGLRADEAIVARLLRRTANGKARSGARSSKTRAA